MKLKSTTLDRSNHIYLNRQTDSMAEWLRREIRNLMPHCCRFFDQRNCKIKNFTDKKMKYVNVSMAEWLRREIRNLMGSARVGSNPAADENISQYCFILSSQKNNQTIQNNRR